MQTVNKNTRHKLQIFFRFLKDRDIFDAYLYNHAHYPLAFKGETFKFLKNAQPQQWIRSCFGWNRTKQGFNFWENTTEEWEYILHTLNKDR